jgi:putative oxidoreductase
MSINDGALLAGRLLLAASFVPSTVARLSNVSGFAVTLASNGMPSPAIVAAVIALAELFGPIALALGLAPRLTAGVLAAASLTVTGTVHRFWLFAGPARAIEQTLFLVELAVVAALLFYAVSGPGAWSWQAWWRGAFAVSGSKTRKKPSSRPRAPRAKPAPRVEEPMEDELADAA